MTSPKSYHLEARSSHSGQAVITSVIFLVLLSTIIIAGFVGPLTRQLASARTATNSRLSYFTAEAGVEDAIYRIKNSLNYDASYTLDLNDATAEVTTASTGNTRTVEVTGDKLGHQRLLTVEMDLSEVGADLFYGVQVSDGGLYMRAGSKVTGSVYSNGDIVCESGACTITGDAIVAGGLNESPSVEWTIQDADTTFGVSNSNGDAAQSFIAVGTDSLNKLSLYLGKTGSPANLSIRITTDNGGEPDTSDLANTTISEAQVGTTASWVDVAFSSPPSLTNGTKYWIVLDGSTSGSNYWHWRRDSTDGYASNTGKYISSNHNWSNSAATWSNVSGDLAFRVWIGGTITKIEDMIIGDATTGTGRANSFVDTKIRTIDCPNDYCIVSNPARAELPISDGVIQDWRDDATLGGVNDGDLIISDPGTFGPMEVDGDLLIDMGNDETLTITGTVWVTGDLTFSCAQDSHIVLDPGYNGSSGLILADGQITVGNNCAFNGSGETDSYLMVISSKDEPDEDFPVMTVNNNSDGVVYYASRGWITFSQNAGAKEVTGYGIKMENNSNVIYESGLANINFTSGPGGAFAIINWEETQ